MSKFLNASSSYQNLTTYSFGGELISHASIFPVESAHSDEISDKISQTHRNIHNKAPAHILGAALRYIWDNFPSLNLPVSKAESDSSYSELMKSHDQKISQINRDEKLEQSLAQARIQIFQESQPDLTRNQELLNNFANEIRLAASQGDRSRSLIMRMLEDTELKIIIFDPVQSQEAITDYLNKLDVKSNSPLATYDTDEKTLRMFAFWDGKFSSGTIIHELGHADEHIEKLEYDKTSIDQCFQGLTAWETRLQDYLSHYKKHKKDLVSEPLLSSYEGSYFMDPKSNFINMFGNYYDKESGILSLNFGGAKGVNILSKVHVEDNGNDWVIHDPYAVIDARTGKSRPVTEKETLAYNAYFNSYKSRFSHNILSQRFEKSEGEEHEIQLKEMHAYLRTLVPEKILDIFCPKGFLIKPEPKNEVDATEQKKLQSTNREL